MFKILLYANHQYACKLNNVKVDIRSRPLMIVLTHMAIRKIHSPSSVHRLRLILENYLMEFMIFFSR